MNRGHIKWSQHVPSHLSLSPSLCVSLSVLCIQFPPTYTPLVLSMVLVSKMDGRFPATLVGNPLGLCRRWGINWSAIDFCWTRSFNFETVPSFPYCCSGKDNIGMRKTQIYITMETCQATWQELEEGQTKTVCLNDNFIGVHLDLLLFLLNYSQCVYVHISKCIHLNLLCMCTKRELRLLNCTDSFLVCVLHLCVYLCPLIRLRVVSFYSTEIHLPVITAHRIETVTKETNTNGISADAHGGYCRPHICLRVIPVQTPHTQTTQTTQTGSHNTLSEKLN